MVVPQPAPWYAIVREPDRIAPGEPHRSISTRHSGTPCLPAKNGTALDRDRGPGKERAMRHLATWRRCPARRTLSGLPAVALGFVLAAGLPGAAYPEARRLPDFQIPWITGEQAPPARELAGQASPTVLVVWNRGCPRCTELALGIDALADSLRPLGGSAVGLVFGPDDPGALLMLLEDHGVSTPQLWDESGATARRLGLGVHHLAVFVLDSGGLIHARLNEQIASLPHAAMEEVRAMIRGEGATGASDLAGRRQVGASPAYPPGAENGSAPTAPGASGSSTGAPPPGLVIPLLDGRLRLSGHDGARPGDVGLFGESLENGTLVLYRADLRWRWPLARGLACVPWLRLSNEETATLTEGAEQFSSRHGTLSLEWRGRSRRIALGPAGGPAIDLTPSADLGAFAERISPLLLQRWDRDDAPPLGGVSGCGACAGGTAGLGPRSLEGLGPEDWFEGARASLSSRWLKMRAAMAVPRWERRVGPLASETEKESARYRRTLSLGVVDVGRAGRESGPSGLPAPWGLRLAVLRLDDDMRTIDRGAFLRPAEHRDEDALSLAVGLHPAGLWRSVRAGGGPVLEYERTWWELDATERDPVSQRFVSRTHREAGTTAGVRISPRLGLGTSGELTLSGRAHWIRTGPDFEPYYRALTLVKNREGGRLAAGVEWRDRQGSPRLGLELFARRMRQVAADAKHLEVPTGGRIEEREGSISLTTHPHPRLPVGIHFVRTEVDAPAPPGSGAASDLDRLAESLSLDLGWEGSGAVEPLFRFEWLDLKKGFQAAHATTQIQFNLRVTV